MTNKYQPIDLFTRPFADNGNKTIIQESVGVLTGRADLINGFPALTETPINKGGIAPNRRDFNGILFMLSAFAMFQQSGGVFSYNNTLNYDSPAIVYHANTYWHCIQENGADSINGVVEPGTNEYYWIKFSEFLVTEIEASGVNLGGFEVGDMKECLRTTAPDGWLICNGSAFDIHVYPKLHAHLAANYPDYVLGRTPDFRGRAPRGYDPTGAIDPSGASRTIGSLQEDAGMNITGTTGEMIHTELFSGAFYLQAYVAARTYKSGSFSSGLAGFDASRVWGQNKIANEFRMKNFSILYCIKHD